MTSDSNSIKQAIKKLKATKEEVLPLLSTHSELQHYFGIAFIKLINGLCVVIGEPIAEEPETVMVLSKENDKLTHVLGIPIASAQQIKPQTAQPSVDEVNDFAYQVNHAYERILTTPAVDVLLLYPESVIRGLGYKTGIDSAEERSVDVSYVEDIVAAIKKDSSFEQQMEAIKSAAQSGEEQTAQPSMEQEDIPPISETDNQEKLIKKQTKK